MTELSDWPLREEYEGRGGGDRVVRLASSVIMSICATVAIWFCRTSAVQFQFSGLGSWSGHDASQCPSYHGAGLKGSCAAFGAMYAKKGRAGSSATTFLIQWMEWLPTFRMR